MSSTETRDILVGLVAGAIATRITGHVQQALYRATPRDILAREERARPGVPTHLAVRKAAHAIDREPGPDATARMGSAVHYATGAAFGPRYPLLRQEGGLGPVGAAIGTGLAMSAVLDEGVGPALGLSGPPRAYPWQTHARGVLAHLAFGAATALAHEALERALPARRPAPSPLRPGPF